MNPMIIEQFDTPLYHSISAPPGRWVVSDLDRVRGYSDVPPGGDRFPAWIVETHATDHSILISDLPICAALDRHLRCIQLRRDPIKFADLNHLYVYPIFFVIVARGV